MIVLMPAMAMKVCLVRPVAEELQVVVLAQNCLDSALECDMYFCSPCIGCGVLLLVMR